MGPAQKFDRGELVRLLRDGLSVSAAARQMGMSRTLAYRIMLEYGLKSKRVIVARNVKSFDSNNHTGCNKLQPHT